MKNTWTQIRKILSKNSKQQSVKSVVMNETEFNKDIDIANIFNNFFASVGEELDSKLPASDECPINNLGVDQPASFFLRPVTVKECIDLISKLKLTSFGIDALPVKLLVHVRDILAPPLAQLINNFSFWYFSIVS